MAYVNYNPHTDLFDIICGQDGCPPVVGSNYGNQGDAQEDAEDHEDDHAQAYLDGE